jgi:hypothetical protein
MALGDPYASVAELEARLGSSDDGTFAALLDAASRAVEAFTRRQFNDAGSATARVYRAVDPWRLPVDDFSTTTGLVVATDGTAWDAADYEERPYNGIVDGQTGWPYFDLIAVNRTWPFKGRRHTVSVTAQWGWAAVPEGIKQTTLNVAAALPRDGSGTGSGSGQVASESIDGYSVSYVNSDGSPATAVVALSTFSLAEPYRRKRFGVA